VLFSQREGIKPVKSVIQINDMDIELRNSLWNALTLCYWDEMARVFSYSFEDEDFVKKFGFTISKNRLILYRMFGSIYIKK